MTWNDVHELLGYQKVAAIMNTILEVTGEMPNWDDELDEWGKALYE